MEPPNFTKYFEAKIFEENKAILIMHIYLVSQKGMWYIIRHYFKTNPDTSHLLYIVGGAPKVRKIFLFWQKLYMAKKLELICLNYFDWFSFDPMTIKK